MTFGFFLKVTLSPHGRIQGDESEGQTLHLPSPIGEIRFRGAPRGTRLSDAAALLFSGASYADHAAAEAAGQALKSIIQLVSLDIGIAIDTGLDVATSGPAQAAVDAAAQQGVQLLSDVHGLQVFEETELTPAALSLSAHGIVSSPGTTFTNALIIRAHMETALDEKQILACRLHSLSRFESSQRSRLLALVTALDVLSKEIRRTGPALDIVNEMLIISQSRRKEARQVGASEAEMSQIDALISGLGMLRNQSIAASIKRLARDVDPSILQPGRSAEAIIDEAYRARNELIHGGRTKVDLAQLIGPLEQLTAELCYGSTLLVRDVCQLMRKSETTVRRYIRQGDLVAAKRGGKWHIHLKELKNFLWRKEIQISSAGPQ